MRIKRFFLLLFTGIMVNLNAQQRQSDDGAGNTAPSFLKTNRNF